METSHCIICELDKPLDAFLIVRGKPRTECEDCRAELKRRKNPKSAIEQIIGADRQLAPKLASGEKRLEQAIELRMAFYKGNALEALYDLAMMPIEGANSATLQVKYLAACRLAGPAPEPNAAPGANPIEGVLAELNQRYHAQAPKIREIRERIITMEDAPINGAAITAAS